MSGFWEAILLDTILPDTESTIGVTVFGPGLKGVRKVRKDFPREKPILDLFSAGFPTHRHPKMPISDVVNQPSNYLY